jgi:hypothetical protein
MPTYSGSPLLMNDEWILLQIKEGPCSAGCDYCYENAHIRTVLQAAQHDNLVPQAQVDQMSTRQLAAFTEQQRDVVPIEMTVLEAERIFRLLKASDIDRAGLIGSEPSSHKYFSQILDAAESIGIQLLVYTAGLAPRKLVHPAIAWVVLHLDYGRLDPAETAQRVAAGTLPTAAYMRDILDLLSRGKEIHLRVNFSSMELRESNVVTSFFRQIPEKWHASTRLKYSFNTRVANDSTIHYETPETLRQGSKTLIRFVDHFHRLFPHVRLISERPLFPCSFDAGTWTRYESLGGFTSSCDMEFTFYPGAGMALCPPSRNLVSPTKVDDPGTLASQLLSLRSYLENAYRRPSFDVCEPCARRADLSCQGGCLGYKVRPESPQPAHALPLISVDSLRRTRAEPSRDAS